MNSYLFFDTNVLEIPTKKNYFKYEFSSNYNRIVEAISKYRITKKVKLVVSRIAVNEIFEHYRYGYSSRTKSAYSEIEKINNDLSSIIEQPLCMEIKFTNREYKNHIANSRDKYIDSCGAEICEYPDAFNSIIGRAIEKKQPFKTLKQNNKQYKDAGFKDAVIWETIVNYSYNYDDEIIFFTKDNDFDEKVLKNDLKCNFKIFRSVEQVLEHLKYEYKIDEEFLEYEDYIGSGYFLDSLKDEVNGLLFASRPEFELKTIRILNEELRLYRAKYSEDDDGENVFFDGISLETSIDVYYKDIKNNKYRRITVHLDCALPDKEIEYTNVIYDKDLEDGEIIESQYEIVLDTQEDGEVDG